VSDAPQLLLAHHLKALKLPTFLREHDKLARQCAAEGVDHTAYLLRLAELELLERERRTVERRIREARFPAVKSLDSFDFAAIPSLNKMLVLELARGEYVARRENVIALGPSGTGKTHVALGLGLAACQKGLPVGFVTAAALVHELLEARDERRLLRLHARLTGYKLLIVDEIGYVPLDRPLRSGGFAKEPEHLRRAGWRRSGPGGGSRPSSRPRRSSGCSKAARGSRRSRRSSASAPGS
jgi:DNA replication protein DnaC